MKALRLTHVLAGVACLWPSLAGAAPPVDAAVMRATVDRYCVTCHSERLKTGGLVLQGIDVERLPANGEIWEKVIKKLRSGAMPPATAPKPDGTVLFDIARQLESDMDAHAVQSPDPGRPVVHRLNRAEYTNAVRDLLGVEIDRKALLPADDASYGFDNVADVLSVTSGLLERYLLVAKKVSRIAMAIRPSARPSTATSFRPPCCRRIGWRRTSRSGRGAAWPCGRSSRWMATTTSG